MRQFNRPRRFATRPNTNRSQQRAHIWSDIYRILRRVSLAGNRASAEVTRNTPTELARFGAEFNNPGMDKPRPRRWFRFSLRTMFVLVTVLCVWLGYSLNWIRQRREAIAHAHFEKVSIKTTAPIRAPGLLWLFGEPGYDRIWFLFGPADPRDNTPEEFVKAKQLAPLFPEARVVSAAIRTHTPVMPGDPDVVPFPPITSTKHNDHP